MVCEQVEDIFSRDEATSSLVPRRIQGPPGKRGPHGQIGPRGEKGSEGHPGITDYEKINMTIERIVKDALGEMTSRFQQMETQLAKVKKGKHYNKISTFPSMAIPLLRWYLLSRDSLPCIILPFLLSKLFKSQDA